MPVATSSVSNNGPSISSLFNNGANCAMAAEPIVPSFIHQSSPAYLIPCTFVIIRLAGVMPLHLVSFLCLYRENDCSIFLRQLSNTQVSSAYSGNEDFSYNTFIPSQLSFASGCSTSSTPILLTHWNFAGPVPVSTLHLHLPLPSVSFRNAATILYHSLLPLFIL